MSRGVISFLIVEHHPVLLEALRLTIENEPGLKARIRTCTNENALRTAIRYRPDVLLYSLAREEKKLPELFAALHHSLPEMSILALTHPDSPEQPRIVMESGARATLVKNCSRAELIHALISLSASQSPVGGSK